MITPPPKYVGSRQTTALFRLPAPNNAANITDRHQAYDYYLHPTHKTLVQKSYKKYKRLNVKRTFIMNLGIKSLLHMAISLSITLLLTACDSSEKSDTTANSTPDQDQTLMWDSGNFDEKKWGS